MINALGGKVVAQWSTVLGAIVALLALAAAGPALAQQDTTPPVLLEFTASPAVFDAGSGAVTIEWCAKASDNLSGVNRLSLFAFCTPAGAGCADRVGFLYPPNSIPLPVVDGCSTVTIPRFSKYGAWYLALYVYDDAGNSNTYLDTSRFPGVDAKDLCEIGPCGVLNRAPTASLDADNDGTLDDADNCPDVANPDQADSDVDLIGDACDAFPNDRDNEQAQCEADLGQSKRDGKQVARKLERVRGDLVAERADADGDGVRDAADACPGTTVGAEVDATGCSLAQFCGRVDATTVTGRKACKRADWKNDEPLMRVSVERDCAAVQIEGSQDIRDDVCIPAGDALQVRPPR